MLFLMRLLAFIGVLWLLRRIMGLFLGKTAKTDPRQAGRSASTVTVKDPVCGMYMDPRLALCLQEKGTEVYFCSETCRQKYVSNQAGRKDVS